MTINEIQDEIIEEFEGFDDWMDKYQMLIDLGNDLEPLPEQYKTEQNLIDGCQSRVWVQCDLVPAAEGDANVMHLQADSDALIVKGILALLLRVLNDHTPQEILEPTSTSSSASDMRRHLCAFQQVCWPWCSRSSLSPFNPVRI